MINQCQLAAFCTKNQEIQHGSQHSVYCLTRVSHLLIRETHRLTRVPHDQHLQSLCRNVKEANIFYQH